MLRELGSSISIPILLLVSMISRIIAADSRFFRYYQPNSLDVAASKTDLVNENTTTHEDLSSLDDINVRSNVSTSKRSSPDTCLTAFSQLVSWRLGVQRSMIRFGVIYIFWARHADLNLV